MRFCGKCGERLEITCPKCNSTNPHQFAFCGKCGQRLSASSVKEITVPSSESERKQVTVFFSDMSGYTAMAEKLDPEEVKEIMGRIFGEVAQVVVRYEGFIEKFIGDSAMALFGVPSSP